MKTIRAQWIAFKHKNIPANASRQVVDNAEYIFYNGVATMLDGFMVLGSGELKDPNRVVQNWANEMMEYGKAKQERKNNVTPIKTV